MPDLLDPSFGIVTKTFGERRAEVLSELQAGIDPAIQLDPEYPLGNATHILLEKIQATAELIKSTSYTVNPDNATGLSLYSVGSITGTSPAKATQGSVTLQVNLDAGITLPAGNIAGVGTSATNRWETTVDVTNPLGIPATVGVTARCVTAGVIDAPSLSITTIVTPFPGWNSVTNLADALAGEPLETNEAFRLRRAASVRKGGSANVLAICSALLDPDIISGIISVNYAENSHSYAVAPLPPNSFEIIIWDNGAADNTEIAQIILEKKAGGIQAYGATTVTLTDSKGVVHQIGFTRAVGVDILVSVTLETTAGYIGDDAVRALVNTYIEQSLMPDNDVLQAGMVDLCFGLQGVTNVPLATILLSRKPAAPIATDVAIALREKALIDVAAADITVIS